MPQHRLSLFLTTAAVTVSAVAVSHPTTVNAAPKTPRLTRTADVLGRVVTLSSTCSAGSALTAAPSGSGGLSLQPANNSTAQKFRVVAAGSEIQIVSMPSGLFIGASELKQSQPIAMTAQPLTWRMRFTSPGQVTFTEPSSNLRLDLKGRATAPGSTFHLWPRNSTCAQRFAITPDSLPPTTTVPATTSPATTKPATTSPPTTNPPTTAPTTALPTTVRPTTVPPAPAGPGSKWVRIEANLFVDKVPTLLDIVKKSKASGADTILFSDTKVNMWFANPDTSAKWLPLMKEFAAGVRAEGMKLVLQTAPTGYGTPVLFNDPSLTTGYPLTEVPFTVQGGSLVPEQTASIANGSFETSTSNEPADWDFQDAPGSATFVDTTQVQDGKASLRFEGVGNPSGMARIFTETKVKPFQQYTLSFWVKTEGLSAGYLGPVVTSADGKRKLSAQDYSFAEANGRRYVSKVTALTKDWTQMKMSFNSLSETTVRFGFGTWATTAGKLWVDGVKLESTPTLNIIRRDALPLTVKTAAGAPLKEGSDIALILDPQLGQIDYTGNYDNYHAAPIIKLGANTSLKDGDRVLLNGYHALITMRGQVGMSWHDPKVFAIMKKLHEQAAASIGADGYLVDMEEVRTGGWEPSDIGFGSSGAALAAHTNRVVSDAATATGKPIYIWSDMFDPLQNATDDHYHIRGSLTGSWTTLDAKNLAIVNWKDYDAKGKTKQSVDFFEDLGFKQIIAGYYDRDVQVDYDDWKPALGNPTIMGSMYTSWNDNFEALPGFAALWWK